MVDKWPRAITSRVESQNWLLTCLLGKSKGGWARSLVVGWPQPCGCWLIQEPSLGSKVEEAWILRLELEQIAVLLRVFPQRVYSELGDKAWLGQEGRSFLGLCHIFGVSIIGRPRSGWIGCALPCLRWGVQAQWGTLAGWTEQGLWTFKGDTPHWN